ncbi:MAG: ATP-dependent RecD-like DNA helicase [Anaerolineales bacterium]|nr:ATP-dependent RecD-like DNA helicase [Anaerolineales bacterium]
MDILAGSIERITFYNAENGYTVFKLEPDDAQRDAEDRQGLVTVIGNLPDLSPGEYLKMHGEWVDHPRHGRQFKIETLEQAYPATLEGVKRYLGSGLIAGIGPRIAERIVDHFGAETLDIIENHPKRLREVPDIGRKRMALIVKAWEEQRQVKEIMVYLHGHGITTNLALKIYKEYGDQAMGVVQNNPFQLARDIYGVGFKTADRIAQSTGLPKGDPTRIEAGILYLLEEMTGDGHVFGLKPELISKAVNLLGVTAGQIEEGISSLSAAELVVLDNLPPGQQIGTELDTVYLAPFYYAELGIARRLTDLAESFPPGLSDIPPMFTELPPGLSEKQTEAVLTALSHPVSILTGGPGTGKTTSLKSLITIVEKAGKRFALASPTGRAAKRLSEATGHPASTIHRLLAYSPVDGFSHNDENPLKLDLLVVDEVSMLDVILANQLLKALEPGTHLLLVGDIDQLPSVGAGDVLRDIIASGVVPITTLTEIFRQEAGSEIITNAHLINQGEIPLFETSAEDFFRFPADVPEKAADWVVDLVRNRIPERFGISPGEIQVLVPMYRGPAGIHALNSRLQEVLNPPGPLKPERSLFGTIFRVGDRVMQTRNDYNKQVFNGDIGFVKSISAIEKLLTVDFEGNKVVYAWSEADMLTLAYAISVHKSQGSEFTAVVIPLLTHHYMMLQRNLLYTAVTRAKRICVLVTNTKALSIAVNNDQVTRRNSALSWRIQHAK